MRSSTRFSSYHRRAGDTMQSWSCVATFGEKILPALTDRATTYRSYGANCDGYFQFSLSMFRSFVLKVFYILHARALFPEPHFTQVTEHQGLGSLCSQSRPSLARCEVALFIKYELAQMSPRWGFGLFLQRSPGACAPGYKMPHLWC